MLVDLLMIPIFLYLIVAALYVLRFVFITAPEWLMDQRPAVKRKRAACDRIIRTYTADSYPDEIPEKVWNSVPVIELVDSEYFDADGYFRRT